MLSTNKYVGLGTSISRAVPKKSGTVPSGTRAVPKRYSVNGVKVINLYIWAACLCLNWCIYKMVI